jgi:SAM-dependent methyltransferase
VRCNSATNEDKEFVTNEKTSTYSQSSAVLVAYDEMARHWDETDPRDQYTYMISKMRSDYTLLDKVGAENKYVLNVGCSFPVDEICYARKIAHWTSVDISKETLKMAEAILKNELHPSLASKFTFQYGDACDLPFNENTFDIAVSMSTIDHLPTAYARQKAIEEMARITKHNGHVIVTVPNRWDLPYAAGIRKMTREKTLHYGFAYLFSPIEIRQMGIRAGLRPIHFASSIAPPEVWLPGYPFFVRYPAMVVFKLTRLAGYFGRRIGYAFVKP